MKKFVLALCLIYFFAEAAYSQQKISEWKITDVENHIAQNKDAILVINFWATFCKPCVAEIPSFIEVCNRYKDKKVSLLLISLDLPSFYPKKIAAFAAKHHFNTPISWLNESNADYFCPKVDAKWSGSIPATLIINTKNGKRIFFEEEISGEALEKAIMEVER